MEALSHGLGCYPMDVTGSSPRRNVWEGCGGHTVNGAVESYSRQKPQAPHILRHHGVDGVNRNCVEALSAGKGGRYLCGLEVGGCLNLHSHVEVL